MYRVQLRYNLLDASEGERVIDFPFPQSASYWRLGVLISDSSVSWFSWPQWDNTTLKEFGPRGFKCHPVFRVNCHGQFFTPTPQSLVVFFAERKNVISCKSTKEFNLQTKPTNQLASEAWKALPVVLHEWKKWGLWSNRKPALSELGAYDYIFQNYTK